MGHVNVSKAWGGMIAVAALLSIVGTVQAESRPEVLERIKPVGEVTVEGQAAPAVAAPAATTPAPAAADTTASPAPEAAATPAPEAAAPAPAAAADSGDPAALAQAKGCLACHQIAVKVVGPAYKDVAAKYKGDPGAFERLVKKVETGGSGNWGQIPMPPQVAASDAEVRKLVKWVLSQ